MLKKYLAKFVVDILPSVAATVIGAYIVNHYIVTKPGTNAPVAAAASTADPRDDAKAAAKAAPEAAKPEVKAAARTPDASSGIARGPGVTARGISEKAILEKTAAERPAENVTEKPAETAAIPADTRRHQPGPREKTATRTVVAPAPAVAPVASPPATVAPAETASASEERRDANDLARAAIDRQRVGNEAAAPRAPDTARAPESARIPDIAARAPEMQRAAVRPLPPPIMVSSPATEPLDAQAGTSPKQPFGVDDPGRPTPPAEIPSRPLDLRAEAMAPPVRERTTVAEDVLSAAKSVFHAVLPR